VDAIDTGAERASSGLAATVADDYRTQGGPRPLGGGVKGIGLAGAAVAPDGSGDTRSAGIPHVAGSIVGAILAAGADELTPEQV